MRKTEWIAGAVGATLLAAPWVLVGLAWRNWAKNKATPAFLTGNILTTLSCCGLVPFALPVASRWEQTRIDALSYGVVLSLVSAAFALFILPFAQSRAKWLSFAASLVNVSIVVMFFLSLG